MSGAVGAFVGPWDDDEPMPADGKADARRPYHARGALCMMLPFQAYDILTEGEHGAHPVDLLVYLAMIKHVNFKTGLCDSSLSQVAKTANISVASVQRARERLVASGFITLLPRAGYRGRNAYQLHSPAVYEAKRLCSL